MPICKTWLKTLLVSSLLMGAFACSDSKTVDEYSAEVQHYIEQKDYNSAVISIKNALKEAPRVASFRYDLGFIYLTQGDYFGAEKEFTKAENLGFSLEQILPKLIEAKFKLKKYDEVYPLVKRAQTLENNSYVIALTYAGLSALYQGNREQAKEYIDEANLVSSESVYGQIGKAYLAESKEDILKSLKVIDAVIGYSPDVAESYLLKAYLLQGAERYTEAAEAFKAYGELRPKELQIKFFVAQNYLQAQQFDLATSIIDELLELLPKHPLVNQLKAKLAFEQANYEQAREYAIKAFQVSNEIGSAYIIAGLSSYYLGDYEQAYTLLKQLKPRLPSGHTLQKFILDLEIRLGRNVEAIASIQEVIEQDGADSSLLAAASYGLLNIGDKKGAIAALDKSIAIGSGSSQEYLSQGLMKIHLNDLRAGIEMLEKAVLIEPDSYRAEAALAYGYLLKKQYQQALVLAKKWQKDKNKIPGLLLEAEVLQQQNKLEELHSILDEVLVLEDKNLVALSKKAHLAAQYDKSAIQALAYYQQILHIDAKNLKTIVSITKLVQSHPALSEKVIAFYQQQIEQSESPAYAKLGLGYIHSINNDYSDALKVFYDIANSDSDFPNLDIAIASNLSKLSRYEESIKYFRSAFEKRPFNFKLGAMLLAAQEKSGLFADAIEQIDVMRKHHGNLTGLLLLKAYYQSSLGEQPDNSDMDILESASDIERHWMYIHTKANVNFYGKRFSAALELYQKAYELGGKKITLYQLAKTHAYLGDYKNVISILEPEKDKEATWKTLLASAYISIGDKDKAKNLYRELIQQTDSYIIFNNLAYLEFESDNFKDALVYATRAVELAPKNSDVLDTYGQILTSVGEYTKAISSFEAALSYAEGDIDISINMAKAMLQNDQVGKAKQMLSHLKPKTDQEAEKIKRFMKNL